MEEKKKVSEAQMRATAEYEKKNYDKVLVRFPKGTKERIKEVNDSLNGFIVSAVIEKLEREA
ncbi:MAG: hypothetical protein LIP10_10240 [Clostridiales bacterium]|nr:hypothetical protein [Clostridiales bacterium]MCD8397918.1 hypothetical protein [Lachnospiraceae bacterium]